MKVKVLGIQDVNMKDDQGLSIDGLSLHCCDYEPSNDGNFSGSHVAKVFVPRRYVQGLGLVPGVTIDLLYEQTLGSKKARLCGVRVIK